MMNKAEKIITMIVAMVGGAAGLWGAYTAHDASKFTQPFDEREQIVKSFANQIDRAEKRNDTDEVTRVSLLLEKYEENWRSSRLLSRLVEPIEELATAQLGESENQDITNLIASWQGSPSNVVIPPKTLGAAYFAIGDYPQAIKQLNLVTGHSDAWRTGTIKAAAYAQLASEAENQEAASALKASSVSSFLSAQAATAYDPVRISGFVASSPELKKLLKEEGIELTNPSSRR